MGARRIREAALHEALQAAELSPKLLLLTRCPRYLARLRWFSSAPGQRWDASRATCIRWKGWAEPLLGHKRCRHKAGARQAELEAHFACFMQVTAPRTAPWSASKRTEWFSAETKGEFGESTGWRNSGVTEQCTDTGIQKDDCLAGKQQKAIPGVPFSFEHPSQSKKHNFCNLSGTSNAVCIYLSKACVKEPTHSPQLTSRHYDYRESNGKGTDL